MAAEPVILRSFSGGELAPALAARADVARYQSSARTMRNFIVQRHGGAAYRKGTRFIGECKTNDSNVRLLRYVHEDEAASILIEAGENYLRFWADDAIVEDPMSPGNALEIETDFDDPGLFNWHQSGRVITLTHKNQVAAELTFNGVDDWDYVEVSTAPIVPVPQTPTLANTVGLRTFAYVVTAAAPGTYEESEPSAIVVDASALEPTDDAPHTIGWTAVTVDSINAPEYYVYCDPFGNGTFGFVGTAGGGATSFKYNGAAPDFAQTPPIPRVLFEDEGEQPHVSATYEQRRYFANTINIPDAVYGSRVGFPSNFGISSPLQDDDAITLRIAGNNHNPVRHMVALQAGLIAMTASGEWVIKGPGESPIIPNGIEAKQATYIGVADLVRPVVVGNGVLYVQARGSKVAEVKFDQAVEGLGGRDLTVFSAHLFDGYQIDDMDFALAPDSIIWCCRSDGTLLGLTYVPEQDVWGWHRHDTDGEFERVCVVPGDGADDVYFVVARNLGGSVVRNIEKLERQAIVDFDVDAFHVDCGLSYSGVPADNISGLEHLNGEEVDVAGDGTYVGRFTVSGGAIDLPAEYSNVHVGLPFVGDLETVSLDVAGSSVRDRVKIVKAVDLIIDSSSRVFTAGRNSASLKAYVAPSHDGAAKAFSGKCELSINGTFDNDGRVLIRQATPLPLTVLAIIPLVEVGG